MTPDDEIPEHDHLADATRRALGQLADTTATDSMSWGAVQARARRVKTMRVTTAIAACVIVLAGVGAVIGTANRNQDHVNVAGPSGNPTTTSGPDHRHRRAHRRWRRHFRRRRPRARAGARAGSSA
jgi:hypothetical protein